MTSLCLSEWPSTWKIQENTRDQKFNFFQLAALNITSLQLYHWSAPIDIVESYQFYLNQLSTSNNISLSTKVFYNCTLPRFGLQCQYLFPFRTKEKLPSVHELIHRFYLVLKYPREDLLCYRHLNCRFGSILLCLDWNQICDGFIQCTDGVDEQHCWQMETNQCKENEYRCRNGQCISSVFLDDNAVGAECFDQSDTREKFDWDPYLRLTYDPIRPQFINEEVVIYNGTGHFGPYFEGRDRRLFFVHHMIPQADNLCRRVQDILPNIISNENSIEMIWDYIHQISIYLSKCNTILRNDTISCDNRTMYQCLNSSKCIAKIRIFDQFEDCDYGDDEDRQKNILTNEICSKEQSSTHFICPNTNKCISRKLIRDSKCDCGYLDAQHFLCPDENIEMKSIRELISFPTICNGFNDLNPILIDGQNYTDETECNQWVCNNAYTRCNGYWDCYDGADEVDCHEFLL
ncbi:unnamed protein product, partial [Adineta steineri]